MAWDSITKRPRRGSTVTKSIAAATHARSRSSAFASVFAITEANAPMA
ncbi:MAG: hypothetical protein WCI74_19515 [Actinomycetes bacterium]